MTTLIVCIRRRADLSHAEFIRHWREVHGPLVASCKPFASRLVSYVQHHVEEDGKAPVFGVAGHYDGIAVLSFKDAETMDQAFSHPEYLRDVRPDESRFIDLEGCLSFLATSVPMILPG